MDKTDARRKWEERIKAGRVKPAERQVERPIVYIPFSADSYGPGSYVRMGYRDVNIPSNGGPVIAQFSCGARYNADVRAYNKGPEFVLGDQVLT